MPLHHSRIKRKNKRKREIKSKKWIKIKENKNKI